MNVVFEYSGREMPPWRVRAQRAKNFAIRLRRRFLPYLVWYGDELDVRVVLTADRLPHISGADFESAMNEAMAEFRESPAVEAEAALRRLGVGFDTGMGPEGRDWEWDFSLCGPISVKFKSRATKPERRSGG